MIEKCFYVDGGDEMERKNLFVWEDIFLLQYFHVLSGWLKHGKGSLDVISVETTEVR